MVNDGPIALNLIEPEVLAPRLRLGGIGAVLFGALIAIVVVTFAPVWTALTVGVLVAVALLARIAVALRRRIWLDHRVMHRKGIRVRRVNTATAEVFLAARHRQIATVELRLRDRHGEVRVPLAMYFGDRGRELPVLALRSIADALARNDSLDAHIISDLCVAQLRAMARDAAYGDRPLYRAASLASGGQVPIADVADLLD